MKLGIIGMSIALVGSLIAFEKAGAQSDVGSLDPAFFSSQVYPIFEQAGCSGCHVTTGIASGTRLQFPEKDASEAHIQAFGLSLTPVVDRADFSRSLLLLKPTNQVPHTGGLRIPRGSEQESLLRRWVQYLASASEEMLAAARSSLGELANTAPTRFVRRLTHSQYDNTVRDLIGDPSQPAQRFPPEDYVDGFKNQLTAQSMPPLLVEAYSTAAERLALNAFRVGDINGLIPCQPGSATDAACRDEFVRTFGVRAFRRPLRESELQRYAALFTAEAGENGNFLDGARVVVEAMLQSPNFLFHVEAGPDGASIDYDVASRLSYLLWNTMPDEALFAAAARGELRTVEGRTRAARRMLDDPRARQALAQFFDEWLRFDRVVNAVKARNRFPEYSPEMGAAMVEETQRLLQHLVWNDLDFMEALTADYGFLTPELAAVYGLPAPRGQFEMVRFPAGTQRAGLLGHGTFLASTAGPTDTSPTARGIFIRERLLCQHMPPPPPGVITTLPDPTPDAPQGRRELMRAHTDNPTCATCHRLMDPLGFGLENFDAIGRWRDEERVGNVDLPIDAAGEVAGLEDSAFVGARQLGEVLARSRAGQQCVARQIFRYGYGRLETPADEGTIDHLYTRFRDSGFKFKELLIALVESPEFLRSWHKM